MVVHREGRRDGRMEGARMENEGEERETLNMLLNMKVWSPVFQCDW